MTYEQDKFWQKVYIAAIRRGDPAIVARTVADQAAKDYAEAVDLEEEEGN